MSYAYTRVTYELLVAAKIVRRALDLGYVVSVNDSEEFTIKRSDNYQDIINALQTTDDDYLHFYKAGSRNRTGWVHLVYGNDGIDVVSDYTVSDAMDQILSTANAMNDKVEKQFNHGEKDKVSKFEVLQEIYGKANV